MSMERRSLACSLSLTLLAVIALGEGILECKAVGPAQPGAPAAAAATKPKQVSIDLDRAIAVSMPAHPAPLTPAPFKTKDLKKGWLIEIPGNRPIATPAYWEGMLFVGGGYGSYEFYAFDARTGKLIWKIHTKDDGPTAAVVEDGLVAFNTESCTVMVVEARTGKVVWQEWLGDPLMSQPAISKGRLYMAYPSGGRTAGPNQAMQQNAFHNSAAQQSLNFSHNIPGSARAKAESFAPGMSCARGGGHVMLAADLKTGRHIWTQDITADVQTAPVVDSDKLYFTCFDGTAFCLNALNGSIIWKKASAGTSAPLVSKGQVIFTAKQQRNDKQFEGFKRLLADKGNDMERDLLAEGPADYLQKSKGGGVALMHSATQALDAAVGFGGGAPQAAQMEKAASHLGVNSVAGAWAYQGSRAAVSAGKIMNAQGKYLNSVSSKDGSMTWRAEARGKSVDPNCQIFSPPALGKRNMYLCSAEGHLLSVRQDSGQVEFMYATNQPMAFQPALAGGNIYVGTANGKLMCLETGDADADGWSAWGGNAQHNKKD